MLLISKITIALKGGKEYLQADPHLEMRLSTYFNQNQS